MAFFKTFTGRSKQSLILLAVASGAVLSGCGGADKPASAGGASGSGGSSGGAGRGGSADSVEEYFDALPDWGKVSDAKDEASEPVTERRYLSATGGGPRPF